METLWDKNPCFSCDIDNRKNCHGPCGDRAKWERNCVFKLRQYEDTNLTPAEVSELSKAKQEGRMVVLPCKVGDKVKIDVRAWENVWNYKTYEYGKFLHGEIIAIIKTRKQTLMKIQAEHNVSWKHERKRYPVSALGKTVFLIPESAESEKERRERDG